MITSKNNPHIIEAAKLKQAKHRKASGLFLAEGKKVLEMALLSRYEVVNIFVEDEAVNDFGELLEKAEETKIETHIISKQAGEKLASSKNPQGIYACIRQRSFDVENVSEQFVIACENLSDPGNMGTIMRTADAVGVKTLLLSADCVDIYNDKVIRASMGSIFNVEAVIADDFIEGLNFLREKGYNVACGHLSGEDFFTRKNHEKNVLVIGNESRGVSEEAEAVCESLWKLPMYGGAESLNAAVAAGIMMYDIMRNK